MKLGVSIYSYYNLWKNGQIDIPTFIRTVHEIGADGVELLEPLWRDKAAELAAVDEALAATGVEVGVYSVSNDFVTTSADDRKAAVDKIRVGVDSALHFGAKIVRVFAGNTKEGISFEQAFDWIVEGLSESSRYAEAKGVRLALENHGKLAGKSDQVKRILKAVGSPALGANPDTGNFLLVHQSPHEAIHSLATQAFMVHFKDFREVPESFDGFAYTSLDGLKYAGTAIGEGDVALESCINELKAASFSGWLNIEYEGAEDPRTALPRSVKYTRSLIDGKPSK
ncbi:MAG: sugar phosphate isomerase/epimerase [Capsulimonadaceae bacterium]|nr:sugar phosphate isomerase/epimerase [Capsulimonadaceae bacterium]